MESFAIAGNNHCTSESVDCFVDTNAFVRLNQCENRNASLVSEFETMFIFRHLDHIYCETRTRTIQLAPTTHAGHLITKSCLDMVTRLSERQMMEKQRSETIDSRDRPVFNRNTWATNLHRLRNNGIKILYHSFTDIVLEWRRDIKPKIFAGSSQQSHFHLFLTGFHWMSSIHQYMWLNSDFKWSTYWLTREVSPRCLVPVPFLLELGNWRKTKSG
jgi:hypothetical protein